MRDYQQLITASELAEHLEDQRWCIADCRFDLMSPQKGGAEFLEGHIPGAFYADLDRDLAAPVSTMSGRHPLPDAREFAAKLGAWGVDNASQVVVYDNAGGAVAARLWWMLRWLGHSRVAVLDGGLDAWLRIGGELESGQANPQQKRFAPQVRTHMLINTEQVTARLKSDPDFTLFDARDRQRFLGDVEPIDAVAGHVPGARNFPFLASISPDKTWLGRSELTLAWNSALAGRHSADAAVMCGSGVTACHLILSAELAGLPAPQLYVGSWSEWIRDPARPVATGADPEGADST